MKKLLLVAPALLLAVAQASSTPAFAHGCGGTAPLQLSCIESHGPWTSSEPKPNVSWGLGFTGVIEAKVIGQYGATTIRICNVTAGGASCSTPRNDHMQCCTENWTLSCTASGVGTWGCDHTGG